MPEVLLSGLPQVTRWMRQTSEGPYLRLRYSDSSKWTDFVISPGGTRVWANLGPGATLTDVSTLFIGPVLGCLLRFRGTVGLHASVVNWHGRAIVLVGPSGVGKSTIAAGLIELGCRPWADDLAVLDTSSEIFRVPSGYSRLRLYDHAAEQLYGNRGDLAPLWSGDVGRRTKGYREFANDADMPSQESIPLAGIYLLEPSAHVDHAIIIPLSPAKALPRLIQQTVCRWVLDQQGIAAEFHTLSRLVTTTPVRQIERPENLATLMDTCQIILANALGLIQDV